MTSLTDNELYLVLIALEHLQNEVVAGVDLSNVIPEDMPDLDNRIINKIILSASCEGLSFGNKKKLDTVTD